MNELVRKAEVPFLISSLRLQRHFWSSLCSGYAAWLPKISPAKKTGLILRAFPVCDGAQGSTSVTRSHPDFTFEVLRKTAL